MQCFNCFLEMLLYSFRASIVYVMDSSNLEDLVVEAIKQSAIFFAIYILNIRFCISLCSRI